MDRRSGRGMTLVEVMVVIVIMAAILGASLLTSRLLRGARPELEAASQVKGLLQRARAQAMAEGTYVRLIRNGSQIMIEAFNADSNRWLLRERAELVRIGTGCPSPPSGLAPVDTVVVNLTGALTPSGPFVSLPLAAALLRSGAAVGPVVAFVTGWALLAVHRFIAWEVPILGVRLALLRYGLSLALPILAGLAAASVARLLPIRPG